MTRAILALTLSILAFQGCATFDPAWMQWEYTGGPLAQNIAAVLPD